MPRMVMNQMSDEPTSEVATASIGVLGVGVNVPIRAGWWQRFKKRFSRPPLKDTLSLKVEGVDVYAGERDTASVNIRFALISFSPAEVLLENIRLTSVCVNHCALDLHNAAPGIRPLQVMPMAVTDIFMSFTIGSSAIRQLVKSIRQAGNLHSSPDAPMSIGGVLHFIFKGTSEPVEFDCSRITPKLNLQASVLQNGSA